MKPFFRFFQEELEEEEEEERNDEMVSLESCGPFFFTFFNCSTDLVGFGFMIYSRKKTRIVQVLNKVQPSRIIRKATAIFRLENYTHDAFRKCYKHK